MKKQEMVEIVELQHKIKTLLEDIESFNKERKKLMRRKKQLLKKLDELELKYEQVHL